MWLLVNAVIFVAMAVLAVVLCVSLVALCADDEDGRPW